MEQRRLGPLHVSLVGLGRLPRTARVDLHERFSTADWAQYSQYWVSAGRFRLVAGIEPGTRELCLKTAKGEIW